MAKNKFFRVEVCRKSGRAFVLLSLLSAAAMLGGCAATGEKTGNLAEAEASKANTVDPYESVNRKVFAFNDSVDNYVAEPIADAYKWVTPQFMQTGVSNFFTNLKNVNVVLNDLLQAKFMQSAEDTGRLLINTTVGVGGLFDVAKHAGLEQNDEDFEQTLAVWGVPQGSYLVIPFLGPSTARGIPGSVFDAAANPATYVGLPIQVVQMINSRANAEGALKFIDEAALDPYVFTRESFLQWRQNLATDGKSAASNDLAEFENELLDEGGKAGEGEMAEPKSGVNDAGKAQAALESDSSAPLPQPASGATPPNQSGKLRLLVSEEGKASATDTTVAKPAENDAYQDAKRKYETARLQYQQLKSKNTKAKR